MGGVRKDMGKGKKLGRCLFYAVHNVKEGLLNPVFWIAVILNTFVIYITQETDTSSSIDLLEGLQSAFQLGMASYLPAVNGKRK